MPAPAILAAANVFSRLNENGNAIRLTWSRTRSRINLGRSSKWEDDRFSYQQRYIGFDIEPGQRVLDVGSGGYPFPYATVLTDRFVDNSPCRREQLVTMNMPFVVSDARELPFRDKTFDFVYCSHVLECVQDPLAACREIMRVGKRGYIETPTLGKDTLFAWARGLQMWHVVAIGHHLCFFEYSDRQLDGIRSPVWRDRILGKRHDPLQEIFYDNQDVFNVMFPWKDEFSVFVFRLDGTIQAVNAQIEPA
jgi:SAM-dependent methyltransferase